MANHVGQVRVQLLQLGVSIPSCCTIVGGMAVYRPLLEPMGLTHPQYVVMLALWQDAPLSVRRLGEFLSLDPASLSLLNDSSSCP